MELTFPQTNRLLKTQFPKIELSYETISHKKVPANYTLGFAIPSGKKYFIWFTYYKSKDVCYLMELNKDKKIKTVFKIDICFHSSCAKGTILYGTLVPHNIVENDSIKDDLSPYNYFVIEDIFYYKGINTKECVMAEKLHFIREFCEKSVIQHFGENDHTKKLAVSFALPGMWIIERTESSNSDDELYVPESLIDELAYQVHHIQWRELFKIAPYINISQIQKAQIKLEYQIPKQLEMKSNVKPSDWLKPQYKYPTVFLVGADEQYDVYHLYTYDIDSNKNGKIQYTYYNVAYIPDYKKSVYMNSIFRKIKANYNLDAIEESDDEDEEKKVGISNQENNTKDGIVDLTKRVKMECVFHQKFKKWVPIRIVGDKERVVQNIRV